MRAPVGCENNRLLRSQAADADGRSETPAAAAATGPARTIDNDGEMEADGDDDVLGVLVPLELSLLVGLLLAVRLTLGVSLAELLEDAVAVSDYTPGRGMRTYEWRRRWRVEERGMRQWEEAGIGVRRRRVGAAIDGRGAGGNQSRDQVCPTQQAHKHAGGR